MVPVVCGTDTCAILWIDETGQEPQYVLSAIQAFVTNLVSYQPDSGAEEDRLVLELTATPKDGISYRRV